MRPAFLLIGFAATGVLAQPAGEQTHGHHGDAVLFLAQLNSDQVVGTEAQVGASGTAALVIDRRRRTATIDMTYEGLSDPPRRIALFNGSRGAAGKLVLAICGETEACPPQSGARLKAAPAINMDPRLLSEFSSGRIYLQVESSRGAIRGQVETNGAMVMSRNYVAALSPRPGSGGTGEGTAVLSETYLPNGKVNVQYSVTVARTSGTPTRAIIGRAGNLTGFLANRQFSVTNRLPLADNLALATRPGGGSLRGHYLVTRASDINIKTLSGIMAASNAPVIAVATSRFANGELTGVFEPVK